MIYYKLRAIKINSSIYENDKDNNFKYYIMQCLNIINQKNSN